MPFKSKSQIGVCYSRRNSNSAWNCDEWLEKTPSVCCLPHRKGDVVKSRCMKSGERIVGKVQNGPRGGKYFTITEKDKKGIVCTVKVYLPRK